MRPASPARRLLAAALLLLLPWPKHPAAGDALATWLLASFTPKS